MKLIDSHPESMKLQHLAIYTLHFMLPKYVKYPTIFWCSQKHNDDYISWINFTWSSCLPQLCHPAHHFPLSWRKQPCGQTSDTFCAASWSHNQYGWHCSVRGSSGHFYRPGQWHGPELWADPHHQVSFGQHKFWRSLYLFSFPYCEQYLLWAISHQNPN